jgi:hypothetical protein
MYRHVIVGVALAIAVLVSAAAAGGSGAQNVKPSTQSGQIMDHGGG